MHVNGDIGHDERMKWCLDCDRKTLHVTRVLRCSTEVARCKACGREE